MITFQIYKTTPGKQKGGYRVRIVGANGEKLFTSEGYVRKIDAKRAIQLIMCGGYRTVDET